MLELWNKMSMMLDGFGWWIEILIWFVLALLLWWAYRAVINYFIAKLNKLKKSWPVALLQSFDLPVVYLFWFFLLTDFGQKIATHLGYLVFRYWNTVYQAVTVIALFMMMMRFIGYMQKAALAKVSRDPESKTSKTSVTATAQLLRVVLIVITILMLLQVTGIPISALLAVGSIGTLTIGFAAKDTLENYMGGAMIFFDRPFGVGDWINLPAENIEGTVDNIGWRLTKIIGFDKRPYYIPNKIFSTTVIENPSRMTHRRIKRVVGVRYDDLNKVDAIVSDIQAMLDSHPDLAHKGVSTFVNLIEFASSSLNIQIYAFTKTVKWLPYQKIQQDVLLKVAAIIGEHGAQIAFPTRTLHAPTSMQIENNPSH